MPLHFCNAHCGALLLSIVEFFHGNKSRVAGKIQQFRATRCRGAQLSSNI
jgi:hypothetical protein